MSGRLVSVPAGPSEILTPQIDPQRGRLTPKLGERVRTSKVRATCDNERERPAANIEIQDS